MDYYFRYLKEYITQHDKEEHLEWIRRAFILVGQDEVDEIIRKRLQYISIDQLYLPSNIFIYKRHQKLFIEAESKVLDILEQTYAANTSL